MRQRSSESATRTGAEPHNSLEMPMARRAHVWDFPEPLVPSMEAFEMKR